MGRTVGSKITRSGKDHFTRCTSQSTHRSQALCLACHQAEQGQKEKDQQIKQAQQRGENNQGQKQGGN